MNILAVTFSIYPERSGQTIYTAALFRKLNTYANMFVFAYGDVDKTEIKNTYLSEFQEVRFYKYIETKKLSHIMAKMCVLNCVDSRMAEEIIECYKNKHIDYILLDHIGMTSYYSYLSKRIPGVRFIYSSQNVESLNIEASLKNGNRNKRFWQIRALLHKHQEKKILRKVSIVLSVSSKDTSYFVKEMGIKTPIHSVKPSYDFKEVWDLENVKNFRKRLLIVGSMNWYPNVLGTVKFVEESFSKLLEKDPDYRLYIVGKNPCQEILQLAGRYPQITVTGFVEDIDLYYKTCDLAIIPVYEGTGLKIKLIEAAGKGIPIITTRFSAKDYMIDDEVFLADNFQEFLDAIDAYKANEKMRLKMHQGALSLYDQITKDDTPWTEIFQ